MNSNQQVATKEQWNLPDDYPFKDAVNRQQSLIKRFLRTGEQITGKRKITVTVEDEWLPVPFSRLYQNKELLKDLSMEACKVLMHMAITMGFNEHKVQLKRGDIGLSSRVFSRAMLELCFKRIISKVENKREWYWVNLTILIVGSVGKKEQGE
jgi:hypothetical protein